MSLELQFKIKNNSNYLKFLRENSKWYKILSRYPEKFNIFEEEVKTTYQLRTTDKISKALDTFDMLQSVLKSLN